MKNMKQLALVGLLSFGIAQADVSLKVTFKQGEEIKDSSTFVVKEGESVSVSCCEDTHVSMSATPTETGVSIQVVVDGHSDIPAQVVAWGDPATFSCEETDCSLIVVAEQK